MTKSEFRSQVWRPYDSVELDNGIKGRVINVCFPTHSVRINLPVGGTDWFDCDMIVRHNSSAGETDDIAIIEDLHKKLMAAHKKNEDLQETLQTLQKKLQEGSIANLRKSLNILNNNLIEKKKTMEQVEKAVEKVNEIIDNLEEYAN